MIRQQNNIITQFDIELDNSKILVTGGAGFIGSNLCEALLEKGNKVICLDNFATGRRDNIENFKENKNFTLIEGDIRKIEDCLNATKGVDYVLHQAALGSVPRSIKDPITSNDVNVSGFLNMLVAARDNGVKRFVYAASSSTRLLPMSLSSALLPVFVQCRLLSRLLLLCV